MVVAEEGKALFSHHVLAAFAIEDAIVVCFGLGSLSHHLLTLLRVLGNWHVKVGVLDLHILVIVMVGLFLNRCVWETELLHRSVEIRILHSNIIGILREVVLVLLVLLSMVLLNGAIKVGVLNSDIVIV
jgi:hypothetical protein